ncbi:MAG TPA: recombination mediator RecR [Rhabdochlamydiaceae bacterium]|jgi:recombination protein RecR
MVRYPTALQQLIAFFKKLPGVGTKTAERYAFHLLSWPSSELAGLSSIIAHLKEAITQCPECRCFMEKNACAFCADPARDPSQICIIISPKDAYVIEDTRSFKGLYHVLGSLLSPIEGKSVEHLQLDRLKKRVEAHPIKEIIIALDSTIEGDTTSLYLRECLLQWGLNVSRLAFGLPLGSSLDFVDGGTLARAIMGRHSF